jgi:hypothetical protein
LDHQPDQFFWIFGPVQHAVDVGVDNIAKSRKDTHGFTSNVVFLFSITNISMNCASGVDWRNQLKL